MDDGTIRITLKLDNNSSIHRTTQLIYEVENYINTVPDKEYVKNVVATVAGSMRNQTINEARVDVYLNNDPKRPSTEDLPVV